MVGNLLAFLGVVTCGALLYRSLAYRWDEWKTDKALRRHIVLGD
jgi:hypothetical protein